MVDTYDLSRSAVQKNVASCSYSVKKRNKYHCCRDVPNEFFSIRQSYSHNDISFHTDSP